MPYNFDKVLNRENTHCLKYDGREKIFGTKDVKPLWVADMDFETPDFIIDALKQRINHPIFGYSFKPDSYFDSIISWNERHHHWKIQKDWIGTSSGVVPSLALLTLALTQPGDKIIVQPPVYFPFFNTISHNGRVVTENPLAKKGDSYEMDFEHLESVIDESAKVIFISNPHNPGGRTWNTYELGKLADICLKHKIIMISDEIHSDLALPGHVHTPLASLHPDICKQTITTLAPSKTFNIASLLTSYIVTSNTHYLQAYKNVQEALHLYVDNVFGTQALIAAYTHGDVWLDELKKYLATNLNYIDSYIKAELPALKLMRPEATYLAWIDFSALGMSDKDLQNFLVEKAKLGLNAGIMFGTGGTGYARLNFGCPMDTLKPALSDLRTAINML